MMKLFKILLIIGLICVVMIMTDGFAAAEHTHMRKEILTVGAYTGGVMSLDPARTTGEGATVILSHVYNKLVNFNYEDSTQIIPELAESWQIGEDGKTWIFFLRKGITFASGNPLTADDVVFSLRRLLNIAETPTWRLSQFGLTPDSITKIDDYTVQIVLKRQYAPGYFLSCLAYPSVGSILDRELVLQHEQDGDLGSAWLAFHSAGSGPFVLDQWVPNEFLLLKVRKDFWAGWTPFFDQLYVRETIPLQQMILLENGEIDLAWTLSPEQINTLRDRQDVHVYEIPEFIIMYLGMNVGYEPLGRSEVRDAIRYAIDYKAIVREILQGAAIMTQTIIPKGIFGYNPTMPYTLDLERATHLLAEAGYPDGFEVELICSAAHPWSAIAVKIQSDLAKIGINVHIKFMTGLDVYGTYQAQKHQMVLAQWRSDYADPDDNAKAFAHSTSTEKDAKILSLAWRNRYVNPETSKLVEEASYELDREKRAQMYEQITDIILDDGPFAVLCSSLRQVGTRFEDFGVPPSFFMFDASTFK